MRKEIPKSYRWECDNPRCSGKDTPHDRGPTQTAGTLDTDRPKGWIILVVKDENGESKNLLCPHCVQRIQPVNFLRMPSEVDQSTCE